MTEQRALDAAWRELEADALASDGRITDADVKGEIRRNRPRIEAAARPSRDELANVIRDAVVRPPSGVCASWLGSGPCPECGSLNAAEWLDQRLVAVREGAERP